MRLTLSVNGEARTVDLEPDVPLLWVLRDFLGLPGTRFGCGAGQCGACTVHVDGRAERACGLPIGSLEGRAITTIEGLHDEPVQRAWVELQVPQCGWCQSGQIMQASALLAASPAPSRAEIDEAMRGVICRCGTYPRIRRAIARALELKGPR